MPETLVLGLCTKNIRPHSEAFFYTARMNSPDTEFIIFNEDSGVYDSKEELGLERVRAYLKILTSHHIDRVILTDTRDVLVQGDLNEFPMGDLNVYLEREDVKIKDNFYNSMWIKQFYGEEKLAEIGDHPISCVSIVAGKRRKVIDYLNAMLREMKTRPVKENGIDMACHNVLIRNGYPCRIIGNDGPVFTCGLFDSVTVKQHKILNPQGQVPFLVHQFDRHLLFP